MFNWLDENSDVLFPALAVAAVVLLLATLALLVLWLRARHLKRRLRRELTAADHDRSDLELALAEQTARLRIIGDVHQLAVQSLSLMIRQADGAQYAGDRDPAVAARSVGVIADAARSTLADLRRVMTIVGEAGTDNPQPEPVESTNDIVAGARKSGLAVLFEETGDRFDLQPGAEVAVNSILKTALTNAAAHGGDGTEVRVTMTWTEDGLGMVIDDDGTRASARRAGLDPNELSKQRAYSIEDDLNALTEVVSGAGITEMRERAALFGGVFNAYSVPGVGFSVSVVFPALRYHNGIHGVNLES